MHRKILHIALPSIVSNITVPLLALVDTTIVGHLGAAAYIGAIAVGGMLFNMVYWLFGFLRMGTGGLTAQAFGADNREEAHRVLCRSLAVALGVSALLIGLQQPILSAAFRFVQATPEVERLARVYFSILVWGAPAVLGLYSLTGWFLGMQNARLPMVVAIVQNVVNIVASMVFVFGLGRGVDGVAAGTLVAQYAGLGLAAVGWRTKFGRRGGTTHWRQVFARAEMAKFFRVNRDIFLRTLCLIAVSTYFTAAGAAQGDLTLAANTLLMQFFVLFSYVMDGFAYAGEAVGGRFFGAADLRSFRRLTRTLFLWGAGLAAVFTAAYALLGTQILGLLTDQAAVVRAAADYLPLIGLLPAVSFAAFLFDGLFIGTTATRPMLLSMAVAAGAYFLLLHLFPPSNHLLWAAFLVYLGSRGAVQALLYRRITGRLGAQGG